MKKKLMIAVPVLLLVMGGAYKFALAKPVPVHKKIDGEVYVLPKDFLINLTDGRFAKLNVALVLKEGALAPAGGEAAAAAPPEGYGALPQEAAVRDIVTDVVTDSSSRRLISRTGRVKLKKKILKTILKETDVKAEDVLLTDVAVQ
jgi:flagellar basal body-associated protein FliL